VTECRSCGAQNPPEARFCNQCGTRIEAPSAKPAKTPQSYTPPHLVERVLKGRAAMQGERKRVTVLFADIKGSTQLAEAAGAEAWHDILDRFFAILATAVHRYEGTVNQYTGDGIMALFGAPLAHEDHAQRACHAALEMQAQVRQFADGLRLARQLNLSMRVGLNTGEVIVGRIGDDLRMDYTAQGLTVNLAARMEHICEPGRVYLSRYTAALVEGYFRLRELGEMTVAGVEQPVEVFELEGEGALRSRLERGLAREPISEMNDCRSSIFWWSLLMYCDTSSTRMNRVLPGARLSSARSRLSTIVFMSSELALNVAISRSSPWPGSRSWYTARNCWAARRPFLRASHPAPYRAW